MISSNVSGARLLIGDTIGPVSRAIWPGATNLSPGWLGAMGRISGGGRMAGRASKRPANIPSYEVPHDKHEALAVRLTSPNPPKTERSEREAAEKAKA